MSKIRKKEWQFKEAKLQFAKIFRLARTQGPQKVVCKNEAVVVVAAEEFERLTQGARSGKTVAEFFAESPLVGSDVDLERAPDFGRNAEDFEN